METTIILLLPVFFSKHTFTGISQSRKISLTHLQSDWPRIVLFKIIVFILN